MQIEEQIFNSNLLEILKRVLSVIHTEKKTVRKQIYKKPNEERLKFNSSNNIKINKLETIEEEIEPSTLSQEENASAELCLVVNELKPFDKQPAPDPNDTSNVKIKRKLFSRNPFSYRFIYSESNDIFDILSWFLLTFLLIIGTTLILNCVYRFVDRSTSNLLYLRFVSDMSNYFPLILTGFLMITFVMFSFMFRACMNKRKLIYFYAASMFLFSILAYMSSIIIINTRLNLENVIKDKLERSIRNYNQSTKSNMDLLQANLHCCGDEKFTDWFETDWANNTTSVPRSCCFDSLNCNNLNIDSTDTSFIYQKGCRSMLTLFFKQYYGDYLIGGFGICCTILLKIVSLCSCYFAHMKWHSLMRSSQNRNIGRHRHTIVQLTSNSKNIA